MKGEIKKFIRFSLCFCKNLVYQGIEGIKIILIVFIYRAVAPENFVEALLVVLLGMALGETIVDMILPPRRAKCVAS
jgi:hypothetical protein